MSGIREARAAGHLDGPVEELQRVPAALPARHLPRVLRLYGSSGGSGAPAGISPSFACWRALHVSALRWARRWRASVSLTASGAQGLWGGGLGYWDDSPR